MVLREGVPHRRMGVRRGSGGRGMDSQRGAFEVPLHAEWGHLYLPFPSLAQSLPDRTGLDGSLRRRAVSLHVLQACCVPSELGPHAWIPQAWNWSWKGP